jgi:hypothetical protein
MHPALADSRKPLALGGPIIATFFIILFLILGLAIEGRNFWCRQGDLAIWVSAAWNSSHTSQHFLDPYTFTHILHGVALFWITALIFRHSGPKTRFVWAMILEAAWELFENSDFIIERYRANTISLDYFGDSIANSIFDLIACGIGFIIAARLGWLRSIIFFVLLELVLIYFVHDSLVLNIVMLLYPFEIIKNWQMQGA